MAKVAAHSARHYLDIFALAGYLSAFDLGVEQETPVVTTFGDTGPRRLAANYDHTHELGGFFDGADDTYDETLFALLTTSSDYHLLHAPEGLTEGKVAYEALVRLASEPRSGSVGGAVLLNLSATGSNHLARGWVLRNATATGTGNGTGQNLGATSAGAIVVATYRVLSGTFTSISMQVQQSTDDGAGDAYSAIADLNSGAITSAGVTRTTTTGATEAWKRLSVTAFSGTNAVILVTLAVEASTG